MLREVMPSCATCHPVAFALSANSSRIDTSGNSPDSRGLSPDISLLLSVYPLCLFILLEDLLCGREPGGPEPRRCRRAMPLQDRVSFILDAPSGR